MKMNKELAQELLKKHNWSWDNIVEQEVLSEDFIREFQDKVNWSLISTHQILSENFIREFADRLYWYRISTNQKLSEDFIREFADRVNWKWICQFQKLSEDFIREFADRVDWGTVCRCQILSEDFIREFADRVFWGAIPVYQKLSEDFIREFADRVDWEYIGMFQELSDGFIEEFDLDNDTWNNDTWMRLATEYKKQAVIDTGLFKCYDDYFIAYKAIREDRYSLQNFHHKYDVGSIHETRADYTKDYDSFGFSVTTEDIANEWGIVSDYNFTVIKVKVYYNDIARVLYDEYEFYIRCCKMEVLS